MRRTLLLLFLCAACLKAAPPRRHEAKIIAPDKLPLPAPLSVIAEVPEVMLPAIEDALTVSLFGTSGDKLVGVAKQYLGCPYGMGMRGPKRFDCSGFTGWVYELEGIYLSRSSREQYREGISVSAEELQAGDLVFFARGRESESIYHVGMVTEADGKGNFKFIHSAHTGVRVDSSQEPYYARHFYGARRILAAEPVESPQ